jgi:steroid delta-isomerase-like uncharacterized protein
VQSRDADAVAELYAEDAVVHHPLSPAVASGRDAIRAGQQKMFDAFSEVEIELRSVLESPRTCAAEVVLRATHTGPLDIGDEQPVPPTHIRIEDHAIWVIELADDGLISEERDYFDTSAALTQLGIEYYVPSVGR